MTNPASRRIDLLIVTLSFALLVVLPGAGRAQCIPDPPGGNIAISPCSSTVLPEPTIMDEPASVFVRQPLVSFIVWRVAHAPARLSDRMRSRGRLESALPRRGKVGRR